ncbi:hypothetical protein QQS21_007898 [Conoideocrella luteorostrata]|uniref:Uncharacterized protein n=1 Tax=Conoideocrella luteorostrata TaxID=1105319 RepID=A0AAJ0CKQ2_9HYPO|nr:hypothetical protein QQS21_007898 [Conoideocrella luteorostrata]
MGLVHPLRVVGMVKGRRRPLAALHLRSADPGWDMVVGTNAIPSLPGLCPPPLFGLQNWRQPDIARFTDGPNTGGQYIDLELAWAERVPDTEWTLDTGGERCAVNIPKFPFIFTCLLLGAISSDWNSAYLHSVGYRPWNAAPDLGGRFMWEPGCTVIDLSDLSYAFVLPAKNATDLGDEELYLPLQPISGHQWLKCYGLHGNEPERNEVRVFGGEIAPVMSKEALQEVWPSFLRDTKRGKKARTEAKAKAEAKTHASRKRKREPVSIDDGVYSTIKQLLGSCPKATLASKMRTRHFPRLLKRYVREHPEQFTPGQPGAVPLLVAAWTYKQGYVGCVELSQFRALSGDQVVELIATVVTRNGKRPGGETKSMELLDLSFNVHVTPDDVARILDVTDVHELVMWDNPGLPLEAVADVAEGRIAKVTSRAGFLAPLERWVRQCLWEAPALVAQPASPTMPTQTRLRQVVWMTLATLDVDDFEPPTDMAGPLQGTTGTLSLEDLDVKRLARMLHPWNHPIGSPIRSPNTIFAELVALPQNDTWRPLVEFYTSLARIEKFMANKDIIQRGHDVIFDRWPLAFPLMMTMGHAASEYVVSSPLPARAFELVMWDTQGPKMSSKPLRTRGPEPVLHGEHTLMFLREPDLGRLRYGLVTRDASGKLDVLEPAAAARAVGDEEAARAWEQGVGALPAWTWAAEEERPQRFCRDTMLLDATAVETMLAASVELAAHKDEIWDELRLEANGAKPK